MVAAIAVSMFSPPPPALLAFMMSETLARSGASAPSASETGSCARATPVPSARMIPTFDEIRRLPSLIVVSGSVYGTSRRLSAACLLVAIRNLLPRECARAVVVLGLQPRDAQHVVHLRLPRQEVDGQEPAGELRDADAGDELDDLRDGDAAQHVVERVEAAARRGGAVRRPQETVERLILVEVGGVAAQARLQAHVRGGLAGDEEGADPPLARVHGAHQQPRHGLLLREGVHRFEQLRVVRLLREDEDLRQLPGLALGP